MQKLEVLLCASLVAVASAYASKDISKELAQAVKMENSSSTDLSNDSFRLSIYTQEEPVSPAYFPVYSKLYDTQKEINRKSKNKNCERSKDYWKLVESRDKLRAEMKGLEEKAKSHDFRIEIIKKDYILNLYENNALVKSYPVIATGRGIIAMGGGKKGKKDYRTKEGNYSIKDKEVYLPKIEKYKHVGSLTIANEKGIVEGKIIHGTTDESATGEISKGCVRLKSRDALELVGLVPLGTKVEIK